MLSRRTQIAQLRRVAIAAAAEYPLADGILTFVSHGENTTFRHDSGAGRHLIRVHRPQRHGRAVDASAAVESEIAWLAALRADTDLLVPEALASRDGRLTVRATADDLTRVVSVLKWMDGRIRENSARPIHLSRLGAAMATLHEHADRWVPPTDFIRIHWDHETFFGDVMVYGGVPAAQCWDLLPTALRRRFEAVAHRLTPIMDADTDVGLIHADLHLGNALFTGEQVKLIDFDDCGQGPRLYDLAVTLWELRDEPDYPRYRDALCASYTASRPMDLAHLDDYIAMRQVAFDLWYTGTAEVNPAFAARRDKVHRWSLAMLDVLER
jgi:Ser/Thr protein kinase RdoA (MazF antagonist)